MAVNKISDGVEGAKYEQKINQDLKKAKVQPSTFSHDPYNHDYPDAIFVREGKQYGIEVKHVAKTSYGSITIKHTGKKWVLDTPKDGNTVLYKVLKAAGVEAKIEQFYKGLGVPFLFKESALTDEQRRYDVDTFGGMTMNIDIPATTALKYYTSKGVDYIQIRNYGFYHIGANPAKLPVPKLKFDRMVGEVRLKKEMKGTKPYYRFVLQVKAVGAAPAKSTQDLDKSMDFLKTGK